MRENLIRKVFLGLFITLVLYGTYNKSIKQYELYERNRDLLEHGTIVKAEDFYRTGMDGNVLGFEYYNKESGTLEHGATYDTGNVDEIIKKGSIKIIYMKDVDSYYAKYYDQVLEEMKPLHIIIQSLSYIIIALSVWIPLRIMNEIRYRRLRDKLQLLKQTNAKLDRGEQTRYQLDPTHHTQRHLGYNRCHFRLS
ncbi:MAG: hypothetical protein PHQ22_09900 [Sulfuricurvum sp.]|nr:hypothetical protein [Sulfuricurvum sp.]MDD5387491.1 hypothetical protein [Sulfuricurvum sp.]